MRNVLLLVFLPVFLAAQPSKEFNVAFNKSRELLYYGKFKEALPLLTKLDSMDRNNPNLNYLLGVSYIASGVDIEKGLSHLEYSAPYITNAYRSGQAAERNAPIYNWYYLGVGYTFTGQCEKARISFKKFREFISDPGDSYVADADLKVKNCEEAMKVKADAPVPVTAVEVTSADVRINDENSSLKDSLLSEISVSAEQPVAVKTVQLEPDKARGQMSTRTVIYTTRSPLYAVQVGAFDKLLPDNEFKDLKNVHSFVDKRGMVRYVVGHCVMRSQAENLRKAVKEAGYSDAFIVDINSEEKFKEEVIHPSKSSNGRKEYRVQLGVFKNEIPEELSKVYLKIDGIKESQEGELTVLTSGSFKDHASALNYRNEMISKGVPGAFVVVFVNGKRQSLSN